MATRARNLQSLALQGKTQSLALLGKRFASFLKTEEHKNKSYYSITIAAMLSFLAWTRNLMIMACRMCFDLSLALCCRWNKVPGLGQG